MMNDTHAALVEPAALNWLEADLAQIDPDKREHFEHVLRALVECYQTEQKRALILVQDAVVDPQHLAIMAINSSAENTDAMIETLCRFKGLATAQAGVGGH